jgi:peptidoglycan/LPS O-acetylase OafA/YrhL
LLSSILLKEKELGKINKTNFYIRRVLRIYPLYFATIAVIFCINLFSADPLNLHLLNYFTFTANFTSYGWQGSNPLLHFWSICAEEQFYLILPWLLLLGKKRVSLLLIFFIPLSVVSRFFSSDLFPYPAVWNFSTSHLDAFALGILIALHNESIAKFIKKIKKLNFLILIGFIFLAIACASSFQLVYTSRFSSITYLFAACAFGLLLISANLENWEFRGKKVLIYIGKRSFGLYVFHWPVLYYTKLTYQVDLLNIESALVVIGSTFLIAELSHRWLESPFMKARVKFQTIKTD